MSNRGKAAICIARAIANITGANIRIVDTFSDSKTAVWQTPNGRYDASTNTIEISLDSSHNVAYVIGHELTHWLKNNAASAYATYQQVVTEEINKIDTSDLSGFDSDTADWIRSAREANPDVQLFDALVQYEMDQYNKSGVSEKEGRRADRAYAIDEVLAEVGETMLANETVQREITQKSTKDATAIARFLRKISNGIKELLGKGDLTSRETEVLRDGKADIDRIAKAWAEMVKEAKEGSSTSNVLTHAQYSIRNIVGPSGKNYGKGVYLDAPIKEGSIEDIVKDLQGKSFPAYDNNGNERNIRIAKDGQKFRNENGVLQRPNRDLTWRSSDTEIKKKAVSNIEDIIAVSKFVQKENALHSHGWLDNGGKNKWDRLSAYIQDINGDVWEAILRVTNPNYGDAVLYDITPIENKEKAVVVGNATQHTANTMLTSPSNDVNHNSVRTREEIQHTVESKVSTISETTLSDIITGMTRKNMLAFKSVERVLDAVAGKNEELRNTMADLIEKPFNRAGGQFARAVKAKSIEVRDKMKELKITKKSESRDIQRYGEGYYQTNASVGVSKTGEGMYHCTVDSVENGQSISREYDFTDKKIRKHKTEKRTRARRVRRKDDSGLFRHNGVGHHGKVLLG